MSLGRNQGGEGTKRSIVLRELGVGTGEKGFTPPFYFKKVRRGPEMWELGSRFTTVVRREEFVRAKRS